MTFKGIDNRKSFLGINYDLIKMLILIISVIVTSVTFYNNFSRDILDAKNNIEVHTKILKENCDDIIEIRTKTDAKFEAIMNVLTDIKTDVRRLRK